MSSLRPLSFHPLPNFRHVLSVRQSAHDFKPVWSYKSIGRACPPPSPAQPIGLEYCRERGGQLSIKTQKKYASNRLSKVVYWIEKRDLLKRNGEDGRLGVLFQVNLQRMLLSDISCQGYSSYKLLWFMTFPQLSWQQP